MKKSKVVTAAEAIALDSRRRHGGVLGLRRLRHARGVARGTGVAIPRHRQPAGPDPCFRCCARRRQEGRPEPSRAKTGSSSAPSAGHYGLVPMLAEMAVEERIEAYNLPLGTITQLYRDIAGHRAGTLTKVGLGTFVDPRQEGGQVESAHHARTWCALMEIDGEEWLFYKAMPITVALIRGTTADPSRQHHHGARGADARQPRARHGREELRRLRDRAGRARLRAMRR